MTFFIIVLPFNTTLRILDIFLLEGYKILYRIALAILKLKEKAFFLKPEMDEILMELKDFSTKEWEDEDLVIKTALSFKFSRKELKKIEEKIRKNKKNTEI